MSEQRVLTYMMTVALLFTAMLAGVFLASQFAMPVRSQEPTTPESSLAGEDKETTEDNKTAEGGSPENAQDSVEERPSLLSGFMDPFIYDPKGRRDPFQPVEPDRPVTGGEIQGPFMPLQRFGLDQLNLVGIIWNVKDPKVMIKDPSDKVHIVRENARVGQNNGYIAAIREGEIVVVEPFVDDKGRMTYTTRVLKLPR